MGFGNRISAASALTLASVASLGLAACTMTSPGPAGDPERGKAVVAQWCSTCHSVAGTEGDKTRAPTFEQVAQRPGRDGAYLRTFLNEDHFPMSTYRLLDDEKADVVALVVSLKR